MKRLPLIRNAALTGSSQISLNVGFTAQEFEAALFRAARSLGLVRRQ